MDTLPGPAGNATTRFTGHIELTLGECWAASNAAQLEKMSAVQRIHGELDDFARRLAETLVDIAVGVAAERSGLGGQPNPNPEADAIAEKAAALFKVNWGKVLNHYLMDAFRDQRYIASVRPEFDASTYGEVLKRVAESEISFPRSDASEA